MNQLTTTQQDLRTFRELADMAYKSQMYGNMTPDKIVLIMMSAKDLGISPMKALNGGLIVVNGKVSMATSLMVDRIRKSGHSIRIKEWSEQICTLSGQRKDNGDIMTVSFSSEDARRAGLKGDAWTKYPKAMLYNRAMSQLAKMLFADILGNSYCEDEAMEIGKLPHAVPDSDLSNMTDSFETITVFEEEQQMIESTNAVSDLKMALFECMDDDCPPLDLISGYVSCLSKRTSLSEDTVCSSIKSQLNDPKMVDKFKSLYAKYYEAEKAS